MSSSPVVLVVDDDLGFRTYLRDLLEGAGYRVLTAADGEEALALLARSPMPSLILTDLEMPGMDGRQLCARLSAHPVWCRTPVVVVSAAPRLAPGGVSAVVAKPFTMDELLDVVRTTLRQR